MIKKEWSHWGEYSSLKWAERGCKAAVKGWAGVVDTKIVPHTGKSLLDGKFHYSVWALIDKVLAHKIVAERKFRSKK